MSLDVDEAGRDGEPLGIDHFRRSVFEPLRDGGDAAGADRNIRAPSRPLAAAVDDEAAANQGVAGLHGIATRRDP
jgi:hypothetical protein